MSTAAEMLLLAALVRTRSRYDDAPLVGGGMAERGEKVSVVIPARSRPRLVVRAVHSALAQTHEPFEVIAVVDGPDEDTTRALARIGDPRLKVVALPENAGVANARNAGVKESAGDWVAFLDDDDEMLPRRLETQTAAARRSPHPFPIVTGRFVADTQDGEFVWPRKPLTPSEPLGEYLFTRGSFSSGVGMIPPSTVLARRGLLAEAPFRDVLSEDWEWLLRVSALEGVGFEVVPEPVAKCRILRWDRESLSNRAVDRGCFLEWLRENGRLMTPRARAGYVLTVVSPTSARRGEWRAFLPLLSEAARAGRPNAVDVIACLGVWLMPRSARRLLRALLLDDRRRGPSG